MKTNSPFTLLVCPLSAAFTVLAFMVTFASSIQAQVLLEEDFEDLELGEPIDEGFEEMVWTKTAPPGWEIDDSGVPSIFDPDDPDANPDLEFEGKTEWEGWSFADKDWWIGIAGDQRRSEYLSGEGTVEELDVLAASLVPKGKGRIWNNAMMDIGATICTAKAPKCDSCPFQNICSAYKNGTPEKYLKIGAKQPKFEESPRYYRGRIIALLRERSRNVNELSRLLKQQQNKITKLISGLERDGLVESGRDRVRLPR